MEEMHVTHEFEPVFNQESGILILGSFPSVKSRQTRFYYGHPRNRFWPVLAGVLEEKKPESIQEKKEFLLRNHIAVWDVIAECDITGSSDSSIRNARPTDLDVILKTAGIRAIFTNGGKAHSLYHRFQEKITGIRDIPLPSTSPANATWTLEKLLKKWRLIRTYL